MTDLLKGSIEILFSILDVLLSILPMTPFKIMISQIDGIDYLGYVNWFLPFDFASKCFRAWLGCVIAYYIYKYLKEALNKVT